MLSVQTSFSAVRRQKIEVKLTFWTKVKITRKVAVLEKTLLIKIMLLNHGYDLILFVLTKDELLMIRECSCDIYTLNYRGSK